MIHELIFAMESFCIDASWTIRINTIELGQAVAFLMASEITLSLESYATRRTGESTLSWGCMRNMESRLGETNFSACTLRHMVAGVIMQCTSSQKTAWIRDAITKRRTDELAVS